MAALNGVCYCGQIDPISTRVYGRSDFVVTQLCAHVVVWLQ